MEGDRAGQWSALHSRRPQDPLKELRPMEGQLVQVRAREGERRLLRYEADDGHKVEAYGGDFPHQACEPQEVDGQQGRCLCWFDQEGLYVVETFRSCVLGIPEDCLEEYHPPPPDAGGFDALWPGGEAWSEATFAGLVVEALSRQGFCVVQMFGAGGELREEALAAARGQEFPDMNFELEVPYMGEGNRSKAAQLDLEADGAEALADLEGRIEAMSKMLKPLDSEALDFVWGGRSKSQVRLPRDYEAMTALATVDVEAGVVEGFLHFRRQRRVCMLYVAVSEGGELELRPHEAPAEILGWRPVRLPLVEGRMILFRHDLMEYEYAPEGESLALQAWVYSEAPAVAFEAVYGGSVAEQALILGSWGPGPPTGDVPHVASFAMGIPGSEAGDEDMWPMLAVGTDAVTTWPLTRWDTDQYYDPLQIETYPCLGKSWSRHGGFLEDETICGFDHTFFGMSEEVARATDPQQRVLLEVGYQCLRASGQSRGTLAGSGIGMFTAVYDSTWNPAQLGCPEELLAEGASVVMVASRLSFLLGTVGPVLRVDTACSSSLVAMHMAKVDLRQRGEGGLNMVMAAMGQLSPLPWAALCQMGMLSRKGRCFTFDSSGDGFAKGEGFGGLCIGFEVPAPSRLSTCAGTAANQDGRSASLTAPNGTAQRAVTARCLQAAGILPSDLSASECHGTGTALGDPIEVGALRLALGGAAEPIALTSVKGNVAHMEASAGLSGIIKLTAILRFGVTAPCVHARRLNPNIQAGGSVPMYIATEMADPDRTDTYVGVQGFGLGGTNARADMWGRVVVGERAPSARSVDLSKADFISVPCPICAAQMCYLCGLAMPLASGSGRHCCAHIRAEQAMEGECCSRCYGGPYIFQLGGL